MGVYNFLFSRTPKQILFTILLYQGDVFFRTVGPAHIIERLVVNWEISDRTAEFGGHIGNCRPVSNAQVIQTVAEDFHKFTDHSVIPEQLCNGQYHIRSGAARRYLSG